MSFVEQFAAAARNSAATVERVPRTAEAIASAVERLLPPGARVVVSDPRNLPVELFAACARLPGVFAERSRSALAAADVGVTEAFAGVARTGSLCVEVDAGCTGYASLLVRLHVAVLAEQNIVERPGDLFRADRLGGEGLRRNFVFITGPSATADMGPLVRGVHGPHQLHILLVRGAGTASSPPAQVLA